MFRTRLKLGLWTKGMKMRSLTWGRKSTPTWTTWWNAPRPARATAPTPASWTTPARSSTTAGTSWPRRAETSGERSPKMRLRPPRRTARLPWRPEPAGSHEHPGTRRPDPRLRRVRHRRPVSRKQRSALPLLRRPVRTASPGQREAVATAGSRREDHRTGADRCSGDLAYRRARVTQRAGRGGRRGSAGHPSAAATPGGHPYRRNPW